MSTRTVTRVELADHIAKQAKLSRYQATDILEAVLTTLSQGVVKEGGAKISAFGTFIVHEKAKRVGRNPKTGQEVDITPRKSLSFRASALFKDKVDH